jgi:hypothetical protein
VLADHRVAEDAAALLATAGRLVHEASEVVGEDDVERGEALLRRSDRRRRRAGRCERGQPARSDTWPAARRREAIETLMGHPPAAGDSAP